MPTIQRLSFTGLEYAFEPSKAYGMSRGGGFRRQGGLIEVVTDAGVRGIGEAFGNPFVTREYFRMIEPLFVGRSVFDFDHVEARIRNAMYHLGVGNQLTACLAGINVALYDAIARGFGIRVCDLIGGCGTTRIPAYASTGFFSDASSFRLLVVHRPDLPAAAAAGFHLVVGGHTHGGQVRLPLLGLRRSNCRVHPSQSAGLFRHGEAQWLVNGGVHSCHEFRLRFRVPREVSLVEIGPGPEPVLPELRLR